MPCNMLESMNWLALKNAIYYVLEQLLALKNIAEEIFLLRLALHHVWQLNIELSSHQAKALLRLIQAMEGFC